MDRISAFYKIFDVIRAGDLKSAEEIIAESNELSDVHFLVLKSYISMARMEFGRTIDLLDIDYSELGSIEPWIEILIHYHLATAFAELEELSIAKDHYHQAIDMHDEMRSILTHKQLISELDLMQLLTRGHINWNEGDLEGLILAVEGIIDQFDTLDRKNDFRVQIESIILIAIALIRKGILDKALVHLEQALKTIPEFKLTNYEGEIYRNLAIIYLIRGDPDNATEYLQKSMSLFEKSLNKVGIAKTSSLLASRYSFEANFESAFAYFDRAEQIFLEIGLKKPLSKLYNNLAILLYNQGNLDRSLEYHIKSMEIKKLLNDDLGKSISMMNIGTIHSQKGRYNEALNQYQKALEIQEEKELYRNIAETKMNIGVVYREKGELSAALVYFKEALEMNQKMNNQNAIARDLQNIAGVYMMHAEYKKARKELMESLQIRNKANNMVETADVLFQLLQVSLKLNLKKEAERYFDNLKEITEGLNSKTYEQKLYLAKALLMKSTNRLKDKIQAQLILEDIIEEGIIIDTHMIAYLHLIDILIIELGVSGENEVLREIELLIDDLRIKVEEQNLIALNIELMIIKGRLHLVKFDINQATRTFEQGLEIAKSADLTSLVKKVENEIQQLTSNFMEWKSLVSKESSLVDRINRTQVRDYLQKVINIM